ncbi:3-hydroxyacyl-CoA dehydrogenase/enoyl-CoA hydratase [Psychroflexus torquis ATCC 700755]|uniref:3-hydroxyacyl-CoA dehydrogenase/enoyl-CoA hydratase n=1 Tax=Psychroflexus torquis (strain ATCC 700755 / CIP 106069 / ACAM 623) TaxID=313595 RepID=K4IXL9_PSYTT|nr:3-hydroxyacyl-CoA dehydrogenase/enoyl-CoA hydratase family protein [Psychroflexus torquis]AFU70220.1 3-hydroxyacyl-CoA dehydrogenase/enoyl-CoA hydratase [Psychroflexus torquis ATCC 700755]
MKRRIKKVAVIGSGIMGSGIACHFANIGVEVLLMDIVPRELTEKEEKQGKTLKDPSVRNRIVNDALQTSLKSNPSPIYHRDFAKRIETGNLEDHISKIKDADWIIEVVVERLDIKQQVFENLEKHRTPGTLISSNTSGIPIKFMTKGRSDDFKKHFCGTHFFNPPRYLKLLEIIPGPDTSKEVLEFLNEYGEKFLGKRTVVAKDTPAFIGNRVGIFSIMSLFHMVKDMDMTIEEVDKLTGPVIGRPKSATFRTVDVVGLDTLVHVANGLYDNVPKDERHDLFKLPSFIEKMMEHKWLGSKTGQGFYKKVKNGDGSSDIKSLDLETLEYRDRKSAKFDTLEKTKSIDAVVDRFPVLIEGKDKAGEFYRKNFAALFAYVQNRIPEITDTLYKIDDAMKAGFGWQHGPFHIWDAIGLDKGIQLMKDEGFEVADWIHTLSESNQKSFYSIKSGKTYFYDVDQKSHQKIPGQDAFIILDNIRESHEVFSNKDLVAQDLGDGILNIEFRSKMNSIGGDVLNGINAAMDIAEKEYDGVVISNTGDNFSVGANIGMIFMLAVEQEYEELNAAIKYFQDTMMRMRYSSIPTVAAPHQMALGGGCELSMHADKVVAHAETYIGLVEFGVGVIPGGGGSKEMTRRAAMTFQKDDVELNRLRENFLTIGMAKVAKSAHEAYDLNILEKGKDIVVVSRDRQLAVAKEQARLIAQNGYTQPVKTNDIKVLGRQALGAFLVGTDQMKAGKYISEHDHKIAKKLAYVMSGGDLSEANYVSEQYLLDLEREAFLSLCGERKTLERLQHMIKKGKPLRN